MLDDSLTFLIRLRYFHVGINLYPKISFYIYFEAQYILENNPAIEVISLTGVPYLTNGVSKDERQGMRFGGGGGT